MVWTSDSGSSQPDEAERIAALEAAVADLQRRLTALEEAGGGALAATPYGAQQPADAVDPWSVAPWPQIVQLIQSGKKIEAIKVYRQYFSVGLKEAKDAVEEVERRIGG